MGNHTAGQQLRAVGKAQVAASTPPHAALAGAAAQTQARVVRSLEELRSAIDSHDAAIAAAMRAGLSREQLLEYGVQDDPAGSARRAVHRVARAEPVVGIARAEPAPGDVSAVDVGSSAPSPTEPLAKTKVGMPALDDPDTAVRS